MTPRFCRESAALVRAVPVAPGAVAPKPGKAARAGFGERTDQVAEVLTKKRRLLLIRAGRDLEAAGALAVARLGAVEHIAIDARAWGAEDAARFAAGAVLRAWQFRRFLTKADPERPILDRVDVLVASPKAAREAWARLAPGVEGAMYARALVVEPGNVLTPAVFASELLGLRTAGVEVEILEAGRLAEEGFGGLLAVGRGSVNPPCLAVLRWPGSGDGEAPVMLVGKGITFDTGGVCIKPAQGLWEMRADMAGAAACAGAMLALARRGSAVPVVALLPLAENAIGAASYRPGDVLTMTDGRTVEVVDTDAEGRLVLADALAWGAARFKPRAVVDLATLTGSIIVALGHEMAGMFASDDVLAAQVAGAGAAVGEMVWRMPLDAAYGVGLKSEIADIRHCSEGRLVPDACMAAEFLRGFAGDVPWVHLDIAGVESHEKASDRHASGPSGWGVRLLDRLVRDGFEGVLRG